MPNCLPHWSSGGDNISADARGLDTAATIFGHPPLRHRLQHTHWTGGGGRQGLPQRLFKQVPHAMSRHSPTKWIQPHKLSRPTAMPSHRGRLFGPRLKKKDDTSGQRQGTTHRDAICSINRRNRHSVAICCSISQYDEQWWSGKRLADRIRLENHDSRGMQLEDSAVRASVPASSDGLGSCVPVPCNSQAGRSGEDKPQQQRELGPQRPEPTAA